MAHFTHYTESQLEGFAKLISELENVNLEHLTDNQEKFLYLACHFLENMCEGKEAGTVIKQIT